MRLGVRGKLFLVSVIVIFAVALPSGVYLEITLRNWLESRIEDDLVRFAKVVGDALQRLPADADGAAVDDLADALGHSMGAQVTVLTDQGQVVGDSTRGLSPSDFARESLDREELVGARNDGYGIAIRYSPELGAQMEYVAIPAQAAGRNLLIRVAMPLSEVDQLARKLRFSILAAGALGLVLAIFMSGLSSQLIYRTVRHLIEKTQAIATGEKGLRVNVVSSDELGGLAGSINALAEALEMQVAELALERDRFMAVLNGMSEGVIALNENKRITVVNQAAMRLLGLTVSPVGKTLLEAVRIPALAELFEHQAADEAQSVEFDSTGRAPRRIMAQISARRAGVDSVVVLHDVSELRRLETIRRDFVANVSHELRTPVGIIAGSAESLQEGAIEHPTAAQKFVEAIARNAKRLDQLIADLLDLSRIEAGRQRIEPQVMPVAPAVRKAAEAIERKAADKRQKIVVRCDENLIAQADPKALDQILFNYLDNAVKYTPEGGRIQVSAELLGDRVRIEVADNGPGIPPKHQPRVFERFYRVDPGRSRDLGGTGLGLAIVKNLAEAMEGQVGVAPVEPHGSSFWLILPGAASKLGGVA
ncbi:MAG: HAMP domain-containing protein [Deltaproteobacteria bacterium]|nr:HAMP domain-containing protein [Deltaproteobacteria bacterium]